MALHGNMLLAPADSGYSIGNSAVFDGSTDYLSWAPGSAGERKTFTYSFWVKRHRLATRQVILSIHSGVSGYYTWMEFQADDTIRWDPSFQAGSGNWITKRQFRDVGSWYHLVFAIDTTEAVAADRFRIWVNGLEETVAPGFSSTGTLTLNADTYYFNNYAHYIGVGSTTGGNRTNHIDATYAEFYAIDGTAYSATDFGEFFNGTQWRAIEPSGLTYGTNGFYLPFTQDTPNLGTDYSGNGNNWTENGSPVQSGDSPTVNYAT